MQSDKETLSMQEMRAGLLALIEDMQLAKREIRDAIRESQRRGEEQWAELERAGLVRRRRRWF